MNRLDIVPAKNGFVVQEHLDNEAVVIHVAVNARDCLALLKTLMSKKPIMSKKPKKTTVEAEPEEETEEELEEEEEQGEEV